MRAFLIILFLAQSAFSAFEPPTPRAGSARLALSYKGYNYTDDRSGTLRAELSYLRNQQWSVWGHVNFNRTLSQNAFHFRAAGVYWPVPDWSVSLEGGYCNNDVFLPNATIVASAAYTHLNWLTPALALTYAHTTSYDSLFASPSLSWSISPTLNINAIPVVGFSRTNSGESVWSGSGVLYGAIKPTTWLTLMAGTAVGNLSLDYLGTPESPLDTISFQAFGLVELFANKPFSIGGLFAHDSRTDSTTTFSLRFFSTYRW